MDTLGVGESLFSLKFCLCCSRDLEGRWSKREAEWLQPQKTFQVVPRDVSWCLCLHVNTFESWTLSVLLLFSHFFSTDKMQNAQFILNHFIEVWLTYTRVHIFNVSNLMNSGISIHPETITTIKAINIFTTSPSFLLLLLFLLLL